MFQSRDGTEKALTALVIDDDGTSTELMTMALRGAGVTDVHVAEDGQKAMRQLGTMADKPDLLVCDVYMPNMDAFQTIEALAKTGYDGSVILMTGGDPQMLVMARDLATFSGFQVLGAIVKPVNRQAIAEMVKALRSQRQG